jgi:hypothetical protein
MVAKGRKSPQGIQVKSVLHAPDTFVAWAQTMRHVHRQILVGRGSPAMGDGGVHTPCAQAGLQTSLGKAMECAPSASHAVTHLNQIGV